MTNKTSPAFLALTLAMGCGLDASESNVKMAGVGLNPDDIGAIPEMHGGLVEYAVFDFAGSGLPLGLLGLVSYDEVGASVGFRPPYRMVYGQGFVFQDDIVSPDALFGSLPPPPDAEGICQTRYEPRSYLNNLTDIGSYIRFETDDGLGGFDMGRRPRVYPPDPRDVFTYYSEIDSWRADPRMRLNRIDANNQSPDSMDSTVLTRANFPAGEVVQMSFPGGIPPLEASVASIPVPLKPSDDSARLRLPNFPDSVLLSWDGPAYDSFGALVQAGDGSGAGESEEGDTGTAGLDADNAVCLQYLSHLDTPQSVKDCGSLEKAPRTLEDFGIRGWNSASGEMRGQLYTGPWDTAPDRHGKQSVRFQWKPGDRGTHEQVSLTVRFLGPVTSDDENMVEGVVFMDGTGAHAPGALEAVWEGEYGSVAGAIPEGTPVPDGRRDYLSCDEPTGYAGTEDRDAETPIEWPLDDAYTYDDGDTRPALHGDPLHTLSEVTCRLDDNAGEFVLTQEVLEQAMDYAAARGAQGAVFYFSRSTEGRVTTPPVRDSNGKRHQISSVKVVSRAVQIGRFWYGQ